MTLMPDMSDNMATVNTGIPNVGGVLSDPPGATLKKARNARKLDLETAADQLNLSASVVRALESDSYDRLPSPTFIRGYIRSYARLLNLSGDDLVCCYERMEAERNPSIDNAEVGNKASTRGIKKGWLMLALLSVSVVAFVAGSLVTGVSNRLLAPSGDAHIEADVSQPEKGTDLNEIEKAEPIVKAALLEPLALEQKVAEPLQENTPPEMVASPQPVELSTLSDVPQVDEGEQGLSELSDREADRVVPQPSTEQEPAVNIQPAPSSLSTQPNDPTPVLVEGRLSFLSMVFSGDCWVEVKDGTGKSIYANLRKNGQRVALEGVAPMKVKLGNGNVVSLEFNGNPIAISASRTGVAHLTLKDDTQ